MTGRRAPKTGSRPEAAAERRAAILLLGGQSTRMGRPKAWLPLSGRPMAAVVADALRQAVGPDAPLVAVAAPGQDVPPLPGVDLARDARPGQGPLEGMAAGLAALQGRADIAYVSSCDVPGLRPAFVSRMLELLGSHDIAVPRIDGRFHPLAAAYRVGLLSRVRGLLDAGRRRPFFLFESADTRVVTAVDLAGADPGLASLVNVNTPTDYRRLPGAGREETLPPPPGPEEQADARAPTVIFELFGPARLRAGRSEVVVAASHLGAALAQLAAACPALRNEVVVTGGEGGTPADGAVLSRHYKVSRNGRRFESRPDLPLQDGDRLLVISGEAGG